MSSRTSASLLVEFALIVMLVLDGGVRKNTRHQLVDELNIVRHAASMLQNKIELRDLAAGTIESQSFTIKHRGSGVSINQGSCLELDISDIIRGLSMIETNVPYVSRSNQTWRSLDQD